MPGRWEPLVMLVFICAVTFTVLAWNSIYEFFCKFVALWKRRAADVELIHEQYLQIHNLENYILALRHDLLLAYDIINKGKKPYTHLKPRTMRLDEVQAKTDALSDTLYEQSKDA